VVNEEDWHDIIGHEYIYTVSFKAIQDRFHAHHIRYMNGGSNNSQCDEDLLMELK
jgi:hypothetical protein